MAFTRDYHNVATLQVVTHFSETATFQSSPDGYDWTRVDDRPRELTDTQEQSSTIQTALQRRVKSAISDFTFRHNLNYPPVVKITGLTCSPLGSHASFIFSMHPGNMSEYALFADHRATISFAQQDFDSGGKLYTQLLEHVKFDCSTETLLCNLRAEFGGCEPVRLSKPSRADDLDDSERYW